MSDFIERVKKEMEDLTIKVKALRDFLSSEKIQNLDEKNQSLLKSQEKAMSEYLSILEERLSILAPSVETMDQTTPVTPPPPKP